MRSIVAFNLRGAEDRALARASMIADLPKARALFAAQDRTGLLDFSRAAKDISIDGWTPGQVDVSGDNTVTRLFALNYATLGVGLAVVVFLYRYNLPMRLFGRHIQEQVFSYLSWAVPLLVFGTALAFISIAMS